MRQDKIQKKEPVGKTKTLPLITLIKRIFTDRRAAGTEERRMHRKASANRTKTIVMGQDQIQKKSARRNDRRKCFDRADNGFVAAQRARAENQI